ncbi:hypothetical protein GobsT_19120 [Gemmata obscuriglobus]|uniref:Uncharacterized protein n=1 Tax=Gemmata obscuriglobus TaxID=114 RepID=A0A2Z3GZ01_9BACT|nr:hypothetical protein [Gemmata obscuriglobus]AWM39729.1 hypothetical protein C1280_23825 [Gemmata obscuriglobus]QEG27158.1 hypothetical protein GobsT_19120 [Gemmata obscuriglobus]VTS03772.1 unnamed protein product [Gemmata obscuriglobus UQM 2246]
MSGTAFLVVRRALTAGGAGCGDQFVSDTGSRVPLRLFVTRVAAEAHASALGTAARSTVSPFTHVTVSDSLAASLRALGFPVECPDDPWDEEWRVWWDLCQDLITVEQRAAVWELFAEMPLFEVLEVELE